MVVAPVGPKHGKVDLGRAAQQAGGLRVGWRGNLAKTASDCTTDTLWLGGKSGREAGVTDVEDDGLKLKGETLPGLDVDLGRLGLPERLDEVGVQTLGLAVISEREAMVGRVAVGMSQCALHPSLKLGWATENLRRGATREGEGEDGGKGSHGRST